jgi:hypothetical protein
MDPALFAAFCEEYVAETNRLRAEATSGVAGSRQSAPVSSVISSGLSMPSWRERQRPR